MPFHWKFVQYHNYERPHMALNSSTQAEVRFRDVSNAWDNTPNDSSTKIIT
jgi:hypothetical protein